MAVLVLSTACTTASPRRVIIPARDQDAAQLDRDTFECGLWAQEQTDFDNGAWLRTGAIVGMLGLGAFGAATGAVIGAATEGVGSRAAAGAVAGIVVGAPVGGLINLHRGVSAKERAWDACLQDRGYSVSYP